MYNYNVYSKNLREKVDEAKQVKQMIRSSFVGGGGSEAAGVGLTCVQFRGVTDNLSTHKTQRPENRSNENHSFRPTPFLMAT